MVNQRFTLKNSQEIELVRESAQLVSRTLGYLTPFIQEGITPLELDKLAHDFILKNNAKPAFLGLYGFPNSLCISVNHVVVHGIPDRTPLKNGDIISVDCGVLKNGYYGDHAYTFEVGEVDAAIKALIEATKESLYLGCSLFKPPYRVGDVGAAIAQFCQKRGFGVVRNFTGHGLGKKLHEDPQIPNYGKKNSGPPILDGMTVAIEPMINLGTKDVKYAEDDWTVLTADKKPSAHFEHNLAVVEGRPILLSTFAYIYEAFEKMGKAYTDYQPKYFPEG